MKITENEIKVLYRVYCTMRREVIKKELGLTMIGLTRIMKRFKEEGLTRIEGFGGSGCDCSFNESCNHCECDLSPYVGRITVLTEKGKDVLRKHVDYAIF